MSDKLKLLPCPFCGGPAEHSTYSGAPVIWCKAFGECHGMMGGEEYDGTAEQLAASWNTRPALDTSPGSTLKVMRGPGGGLYLSGVEDLREGDVFRRDVRS